MISSGSSVDVVSPDRIIGLANLLATDRAIADARYPAPDIKAGPAASRM